MNQEELLSQLEALRKRVTELEESREELRKTGQALRDSEEKFRSLFENNPAPLWEEDFSEVKASIDALKESGVTDFLRYFDADPDAVWRMGALVKIINVNQAALELYGAATKPALMERLQNVLCSESFDALALQMIAIAEGQTDFRAESVNRNLEGRPRHIVLRWSVAPGHEKTYSRVLVFTVDITDLRKAEQTLRESEERYKSLVEKSNLAIFISKTDGLLVHVNPRMAEMAGYDGVQDMIGVRADSLCTDVADRERLIEELRRKSSVQNFEVCASKKDGTPHWISLSAVLQRDGNGNPTEIHGIAEDVTERRTSGEKIKAALQEKEVLLREIHHRVKNNLAVVSSLLGLQSRHARDDYHRGMFIESQDRIRAMALAHEKLYQAENLAAINSKDYLSSLVNHLFGTLGHVGLDLELNTRISEVELDLETGVTLGFIVTELFSNCMKHAFPGGGAGRVSVALERIDDSTLELSVQDNGIGLAEDVEFRRPSTLGLDLVRVFCRQLRGQVHLARDSGTRIAVRFSRKR